MQASADALGLVFRFSTRPLELRHDVVALSVEFNGKAHIIVFGERQEFHLNGECTAVEGIVVEDPVNGIVDIKMQALHHLFGDGRALQRKHFIVDVRGAVASKFADLLLDASLSALYILDHECGITGIDRCGAENLQYADAQTEHDGNDKPIPFADAQVYGILEIKASAVGFLLRSIYKVGHVRFVCIGNIGLKMFRSVFVSHRYLVNATMVVAMDISIEHVEM